MIIAAAYFLGLFVGATFMWLRERSEKTSELEKNAYDEGWKDAVTMIKWQ